MNNKALLLRLFVLVAAVMCALGVRAAEAYANYTPSNTTLTFYYDNQRSSRTGTTYDPNYTNGYYARIDGGPSSPGYFTDKTAYVPGDANGDGHVTIADVTAMISLLMSGSAVDNPAADVNGDGHLTIGDVTALISRLMTGQ